MGDLTQLLAALEHSRFQATVNSWSNKVMSLANAAYHGDMAEDFADLKGDWPESLQLGLSVHGDPISIFAEAIEKLPSPRLVTATELGDAFAVYLNAADRRFYGDFEDLYNCFLDHVRYRLVVSYRSALLPIWEVRIDEGTDYKLWIFETGMAIAHADLLGKRPDLPPKPNVPDTKQPLLLWSYEDKKLEVVGVQTASLHGEHSRSGNLVVRLEGQMSELAAQRLADDFIPVTKSLLRSVSFIHPDGREPGESYLPALRLDDIVEYRAFISSSLSLLFGTTHKKSMDQRFLIALRLLAQADRQSLPAITLALSVTAIEALLGRKGGGDNISASLADFIPILLEPDTTQRANASAFFKKLYDARSKTLHGEHLNADLLEAENARKLAAGCLYGLWFRSDLQKRLGEQPDTPDELLQELREHRWTGRVPDGVPDLSTIRALWKNAAQATTGNS